MENMYKLAEVEEELIKGCRRNDRKAQKTLYDRYKNAMFSTACRITGDYVLAQDALQEAFIDVFVSIGDYEAKSSVGAWIKTIVVRRALCRLKIEKRIEQIEIIEDVELNDEELNFTAEELDNAIKTLPESARAVFLLIEVEGYKHQEVAEMLSVSIGTTKSQLNYSKKLLKRRLYERF